MSEPSLLLVPVCASSFGFVSGLLTASQRASLQFLAENAHRQPSTLQGWYFYNKTKNYRVALVGLAGGLKTAGRLGLWTSAFVGVQETLASAGTSLGMREVHAGAASGTLLAVAASALCQFSIFRRSKLQVLMARIHRRRRSTATQDAAKETHSRRRPGRTRWGTPGRSPMAAASPTSQRAGSLVARAEGNSIARRTTGIPHLVRVRPKVGV